MRTWSALLVLTLVSGCSYVRATSLYREDPDLRHVTLATGSRERHPEALGLVTGRASAWSDCDAVARRALRAMLEEARALGATRVIDAQFRGRFHWTGHPVCRRTFWRKSVLVRGSAVP